MKKKKAFTLVELLVVIAIIALLLSLLMPALNRVRAQARKIVCGNSMKGTIQGELLYSNDDRLGRLVPGGYHGGAWGDRDVPNRMDLKAFAQLCSYVGTSRFTAPSVGGDQPLALNDARDLAQKCLSGKIRDAFVCPELRRETYTWGASQDIIGSGGTYSLPTLWLMGSDQYSAQIGYNYYVGFGTDTWPTTALPDSRYTVWKSADRNSSPGSSVIMTDNSWYYPPGSGTAWNYKIVHSNTGLKEQPSTAPASDPAKTVAGAGNNIGCVDGSVTFRPLNQLNLRLIQATKTQRATTWTFTNTMSGWF